MVNVSRSLQGAREQTDECERNSNVLLNLARSGSIESSHHAPAEATRLFENRGFFRIYQCTLRSRFRINVRTHVKHRQSFVHTYTLSWSDCMDFFFRETHLLCPREPPSLLHPASRSLSLSLSLSRFLFLPRQPCVASFILFLTPIRIPTSPNSPAPTYPRTRYTPRRRDPVSLTRDYHHCNFKLKEPIYAGIPDAIFCRPLYFPL